MTQNSAWLTLIADSTNNSRIELPFYFPAEYTVQGSRYLTKPQPLGRRQPVYVSGNNAQVHTLTELRCDGYHEYSVLPYLQLVQLIEASDSVCSLVFPTNREVVSPLLLDNFEWKELQYLAGTGYPTVASLTLVFTSF